MEQWSKIIKFLHLTLLTDPAFLKREIRGAYCGDLLSDVLANSLSGNIWITIHRHRNVIAVASLLNLCGVIITGNRQPDRETLAAAEMEGVPIFTTPLNNFAAAGRLYHLLELKLTD
ncbi:iron-sulfur binding hydrogenase [Desulfofarcimen acetoxidans DSM 771]|uniref:Iron-sulfur binding hydrogenase n=1 Tax=Desulfofarcimen acetoxidans (strain ATCC 49208 / DSM 771 / KCTC 5769 / VKM B-1644 / 5575) TaxID=485916 RepID=C8W2X6_DESAS|nr:DRTGG domain-containing protein [Desulfofarcimen acetoxidans]ACV61132.1 iron-sulfur binding hydrogenase [Desulfofarcimen acetoxidans DSM 771]